MNCDLTNQTQEYGQLSNRCVVTMHVDTAGQVFVRSCEILGANFRNRTSFGDRTSLESAFSDRMASGIRECLSRLSMRTEVLSLPTHAIELPHLALSGPRIVATKLDDGTTNIIMRFRSFFGSINHAFRKNVGFDFKLSDATAEISAEVLQEIATPLLNIAAAMDAGPGYVTEKLGDFGRFIASQSHEIRFQVELLNRFIHQQSQISEASSRGQLPKGKNADIQSQGSHYSANLIESAIK